MGKSPYKALKIGLNANPDTRTTMHMSNDTNVYVQAVLKSYKPFISVQWTTYKEGI